MTGRAYNPLQLLWLKEIGAHEIWGTALGSAGRLASKPGTKAATDAESTVSRAAGPSVPDDRRQVSVSAAIKRIKATSPFTPAAGGSAHGATAAFGYGPPPSMPDAGKRADSEAAGKTNLPDEKIIHWLTTHQSDTADLSVLKALLQDCRACALHQHRDRIVLSHVSDKNLSQRDYFFIIDSPSKDDDATGLALEGPRGELFRNILKALNIDEQSVYVTPMVKCHPFIADLEAQHISACGEVLAWQIEQVKPRFLIALGETAGYLLELQGKLSDWRQQDLQYQSKTGFTCPVIATHDLRYMLVNQTLKAQVWEDLKKLASHYKNMTDE